MFKLHELLSKPLTHAGSDHGYHNFVGKYHFLLYYLQSLSQRCQGVEKEILKDYQTFQCLNIAFNNILILNFEFKRRNFYTLKKILLIV